MGTATSISENHVFNNKYVSEIVGSMILVIKTFRRAIHSFDSSDERSVTVGSDGCDRNRSMKSDVRASQASRSTFHLLSVLYMFILISSGPAHCATSLSHRSRLGPEVPIQVIATLRVANNKGKCRNFNGIFWPFFVGMSPNRQKVGSKTCTEFGPLHGFGYYLGPELVYKWAIPC